MSDSIGKKIYYRITFRITSALSVGNGENRYSDSDMLRDSAGDPFVPGSSLAGIYRSLLSKEDGEIYFGTAKNEDQGIRSKVLVYDAKLRSRDGASAYSRSIRDCVGLDQWKTGRTGCKFDFEVVQPGAEFVTYLEQNCQEGDLDIGRVLAMAWEKGRIRIGRKTMRGLGSVEALEVCCKSFDFASQETKAQELDRWLDFDMYRDEDWKGTELKEACWIKERQEKKILLEYTLRQRGGISIRRYTTQVSGDKVQPDAQQLTCIAWQDGKEIPYIPGTSWAGAFRHHMERLQPGCTESYFGSCERRSQVCFGESFINGASSKILTRNAVDRFTGGVVDNALFTEKTWYGGETVLRIEIPEETDIRFRQALAASLTDLHMGILSVGGLTAVGRGIFEGVSLRIDKEPVKIGEEMYGEILKRLEGGR